jgi:hypothetical protein
VRQFLKEGETSRAPGGLRREDPTTDRSTNDGNEPGPALA